MRLISGGHDAPSDAEDSRRGVSAAVPHQQDHHDLRRLRRVRGLEADGRGADHHEDHPADRHVDDRNRVEPDRSTLKFKLDFLLN